MQRLISSTVLLMKLNGIGREKEEEGEERRGGVGPEMELSFLPALRGSEVGEKEREKHTSMKYVR